MNLARSIGQCRPGTKKFFLLHDVLGMRIKKLRTTGVLPWCSKCRFIGAQRLRRLLLGEQDRNRGQARVA